MVKKGKKKRDKKTKTLKKKKTNNNSTTNVMLAMIYRVWGLTKRESPIRATRSCLQKKLKFLSKFCRVSPINWTFKIIHPINIIAHQQ